MEVLRAGFVAPSAPCVSKMVLMLINCGELVRRLARAERRSSRTFGDLWRRERERDIERGVSQRP